MMLIPSRRFFRFLLIGNIFAICILLLAFTSHAAFAAAAWERVSTPKGTHNFNDLASIASTSSTDAWTVGTVQDGSSINSLIEHWNGHSWKVIPAAQSNPGQNSLVGVTTVSSSDAWAVGTTGPSQVLIEHWNGTRWSLVPTPVAPPFHSYALNAVTAISSTDVWAVGYDVFVQGQQSLALHWDGSVWSVIPTAPISQNGYPADDALNSVTAISSTDVWAAGSLNYGDQSLVEHWDGTSWSVVATPVPSNRADSYSLSSISTDSSGHLWAVGQDTIDHTSSLIERWTGSAWSIVPSPLPPTIGDEENDFLRGVTVVNGTSAWAVGSYYASIPPDDLSTISDTLVEHWDGTNWTVVSSPNVDSQNGLNAVTSFHGQTGAVGFTQTSTRTDALIVGCNCA